jgi:hypothetical protein
VLPPFKGCLEGDSGSAGQYFHTALCFKSCYRLNPNTMMKHWLIINENSESAFRLKGLLEKEDTQAVIHIAHTDGDIEPIFHLFPVELVFVKVNQWNHEHFIGRSLRFVFIAGPREFFKEELNGPNLLYLRDKPYKLRDVILLMIKLEKALPLSSTDFFFIRSDRRIHKIFFNDILLIERKDVSTYSQLCTTKGKYMLLYSMKHWQDILPHDRFKRVADKLILPVQEEKNILYNVYKFEGREIKLTNNFEKNAWRKESIPKK